MYENRNAFKRMIRLSEGTENHPLTKNHGYDVIVTGIDSQGRATPEVFTDYRFHPFAIGNATSLWRAAKVINKDGLQSTASGGYQILRRYWIVYSKRLNLPDFSPASQDLYCDQQLRERHAIELIDGGYVDAAIRAVAGLWASMPGPANAGQSQHPYDVLRGFYTQSGGAISSP